MRLVEGGEFSTFAHKEVAAGDVLEVMVPAGRFVLDPAAAPAAGHYAAIVGGSGITPVLSIAGTLLAARPDARFCLVRSDRTAASTMFLDEVADLKDRFPDRFQLVTVLSREEQESGLPSGRLDEERLKALLPALLPVAEVSGWFLCGPYGLVMGAERALGSLGVPRTRIHEEIFHVEDTAPPARRRPRRTYGSRPASTAAPGPGRSATANPCSMPCCATARTPRTPARAGSVAPAGRSWSRARSGWTGTSRWRRRRRRPGSCWPASRTR